MDKEPSEIAKLTERISKDPKSKLFVPLAEEYKKAGDIDMSIHVLNEGLKNNPGYVTARSFLGKLLIEKGDLPSAQKEFEEVVRAIPDNLMAQRKLADLYALQDRQADAVAHYKTALSLNPKDAETAALLAEAEAGRDIKALLLGTKPSGTPAQKAQTAVKPASAAPAAPSPRVPPVKPVEEKPAEAAAPVVEDEIPEEVLAVEPLDVPETAAPIVSSGEPFAEPQPASAPDIPDFLAEAPTEPERVLQTGEQTDDDLFGLNELAPAAESPDSGHDVFSSEQTEPFVEAESEPGEAGDILVEPELPEAEPQEAAAAAGEQADDFTTDTLAELYISQGFFEKAVDIYERMLVDNPNSQGLKDKLAHVRAMAAGAPAGDVETETIEAELVEDVPAGLEPSEEIVPSPEGEPAALPEQAPHFGEWEVTATGAVPPEEETEVFKPAAPKQFDAGFEPREYVPPDAVLVNEQAAGESAGPLAVQPFEQTDQTAKPSRKLTAADKKETVDRLEKWLKNIRKEN